MKNSVAQVAPAELYALQGELQETSRRVKYSRAQVKKRSNTRIADLEWRIQFAQMKLCHWRDAQNGKWQSLKRMQERALAELNGLKAA